MIQIYATNDDLEMVCKVFKDGLLHAREQDFNANAKLIVSSPKLLESLHSAIQLLKETTEFEVLEHYKSKVLEFETLIEDIIN